LQNELKVLIIRVIAPREACMDRLNIMISRVLAPVIRDDAGVFVCYRECILQSLYINIPVYVGLKFISIYE